ncbi:MAG: trigger factor [Alphaproteobacteria bacterium]|nr:trigger factor [Alphaproteobacteria bacterium]
MSKLAQTLKIKIPAKTFADKMTVRLEKIQKDAKIQGFRPGKAPLEMIRQKYENAVKGEVLDDLVNEEVAKELKAKDMRPAMRPSVKMDKFEDGKDITLTVEFEALPKIKVNAFDKIKIDRMSAMAGDKEVQESLDKLAATKKTTEPVADKRATKKGDVVVIDFVGSIDGKEFKGGSGKGYYLDLGSNTFIPGFEDQLIGKNVGDSVDVNVTFPENYHAKDLAGKKALFKTDIKELRAWKGPEVNDEFAKQFGLENLAKLKEAIKNELNKEYGRVARIHAKRALLDALAAEYDFDIPEGMVEAEFKGIWAQYEQAKKAGQLDEDDKKKSEDALKKEYKAIAERRVRLGLLLAQIADENKVQVTQEDMQNALMAEAHRYPGQEQQVFEYYTKNPQAMDALRAPVFEEKIVDFLLGKVKVTEKPVTVADLYAFDPDKKATK